MLLIDHAYGSTYNYTVFYQSIAVAIYTHKFQMEIGAATDRDFYIETAHT